MTDTTNTPTPETVKRYEYVQDVEGGETMHPIGARWAAPPNGQYVQAKDYDALETRLTAAEARLRKIHEYFLKEAKHDCNCTCGSDGEPSGCYIHDTLNATGIPRAAPPMKEGE